VRDEAAEEMKVGSSEPNPRNGFQPLCVAPVKSHIFLTHCRLSNTLIVTKSEVFSKKYQSPTPPGFVVALILSIGLRKGGEGSAIDRRSDCGNRFVSDRKAVKHVEIDR